MKKRLVALLLVLALLLPVGIASAAASSPVKVRRFWEATGKTMP